jgi:hypothetical protein
MMEMPPDGIYLLPIRLDECDLPNIQTPGGEIRLSDFQAADFFTLEGRELLLQTIEAKTTWRRPPYAHLSVPMLSGLSEAADELERLLALHWEFRAAVVCTDRIAEFLRTKDSNDPFFDHRKMRIAVMAPKGQWMAERAYELTRMKGSGAHPQDYSLAGTVQGLLDSLSNRGGKLAASLELSLFDAFLPYEIWMFSEELAIIGLLNSATSTESQPFLVCRRNSPLFPSISRVLDHIFQISIPMMR